MIWMDARCKQMIQNEKLELYIRKAFMLEQAHHIIKKKMNSSIHCPHPDQSISVPAKTKIQNHYETPSETHSDLSLATIVSNQVRWFSLLLHFKQRQEKDWRETELPPIQ